MTGTVTTAFPLSLQDELPQGIHDFSNGGDVFKMALITGLPTGSYGEGTTNYSDLTGNADEVPNGSGYTTGGYVFYDTDNITPALDTRVAVWQWSVNPSWVGANFSTCGCIIYNSSKANRAVYVGSFGGVVTLTGNTLNLNLPVNAALTALLRLKPST